MKKCKLALMIHRFDLRLKNNPALNFAIENANDFLPIFILDPEFEIGEAQYWWLHHSLMKLQNSYRKRNQELYIFQGDSEYILSDLLKKTAADLLCFNDIFEPKQLTRSKKILSSLNQKFSNLTIKNFNSSLLTNPAKIFNKTGGTYRVYTPYWRTIRQMIVSHDYGLKNNILEMPKKNSEFNFPQDINSLNLLNNRKNWADKFNKYWQVGEDAAQEKLTEFLANNIFTYKHDRDFPNLDATSKLSPHIHFGEISVVEAFFRAHKLIKDNYPRAASIECFLSEIAWRDFAYYQLYHFPELDRSSFNPKFEKITWDDNPEFLEKWQLAKTGYPLIDAAMSELYETGYMHNRARMIVASFLTKDLHIHWLEGAKWFKYCLLDADIASNYASWQWVAGSGADAMPYYRIFNPLTQSNRFDKEAKYIKKWCKTLTKIPAKEIHAPWLIDRIKQKEYEVNIGDNYPSPIVNHDWERKDSLERYNKIK